MPVIGGAEFLRRRQANKSLAEIPILVLSANIHTGVSVDAIPFIPKHVDVKSLLKAIGKLIECAPSRANRPK